MLSVVASAGFVSGAGEQAAAKRKATGAVTKTPKKTREGPGGGDDGLLLEDDEYPLPNLMHSGVGQYMPNGEYMH